MGTPSAFLRLWGCNFTCAGFSSSNAGSDDQGHTCNPADAQTLEDLPVITRGCDSIYAWGKEFQHLSKTATAPGLCDIIEELCPSFCHALSGQSVHLILTGGEPMLSQTAITEMMVAFRQRENTPSHITIETNGTRPIRDELRQFIESQQRQDGEWFWSVSPKLSISGEPWHQAIKPQVLSDYQEVSNAGQLKYVVDGSEQCWDEVERATTAYRQSGISWDVWIMPVGASLSQQQDHQEQICLGTIKRDYNFSPRVHNWIFGNRVGT